MPLFRVFGPSDLLEPATPRKYRHRHHFQLAQGMKFENGNVVLGQPGSESSTVWVCRNHENEVVVASLDELVGLIYDKHARMQITVLDTDE